MIKSWFNTIATQLAGMIEVSDEKIIQYSNGEVNRTTWDTENDLKTGTIIDPVIFGDLARENMSKISSEGINKLGHIALPIAVVNIQYMRGRKPVLVKELGMKLQELEDIVYGRTYIPADADCSRAISVSEYMKVSNSKKEDYLTGGEAVSKMMERKQVPKEIKDAAVIHYIPVMPICMRYFWCDPEKRYLGSSLNNRYESLLARINRYKRLEKINCPEVIMLNERRELQGYVDMLISNGSHSYPAVNSYTCQPDDSLEELFATITELSKKNPPILKSTTDILAFISKAEEIHQYNESLNDETYALDSPEMQKLGAMEEELKEILRPFLEMYLEENHKIYLEFVDSVFQYAVHSVPQAAELMFEHAKENGVGGFHPENEEHIAFYTKCVKDIEQGIANAATLYIKKQLRFTFATK